MAQYLQPIIQQRHLLNARQVAATHKELQRRMLEQQQRRQQMQRSLQPAKDVRSEEERSDNQAPIQATKRGQRVRLRWCRQPQKAVEKRSAVMSRARLSSAAAAAQHQQR